VNSTPARPLQDFYDSVNLDNWTELLGADMHYHFGQENEYNIDIFEYSVHRLLPFIEANERVLDCGCGWGGPANLISRERNASVTSITCSGNQARYAAARHPHLDVRHQDLHEFHPDTGYGAALFVESYTHLADPVRVLNHVARDVRTILMRDHYSLGGDFFAEHWHMRFPSRTRLESELAQAGFRIEVFENVMPRCAKATAEYWKRGIERIMTHRELDAHMVLLHELSCWILDDVDRFLDNCGLALICARSTH
jgi:SAM-dependent methyltransferase